MIFIGFKEVGRTHCWAIFYLFTRLDLSLLALSLIAFTAAFVHVVESLNFKTSLDYTHFLSHY